MDRNRALGNKAKTGRIFRKKEGDSMLVSTKLKKATFKHIEAELYAFHDTLKEIERLKEDIVLSNDENDENVGGTKGNFPSSPTEAKVTALLTHKRLQRLEEIVNAISRVYTSLPEDYKKLVKLKYWTKPQKLTWDGIADELKIGRATAFRWRDEIIYAIAEVLGWR